MEHLITAQAAHIVGIFGVATYLASYALLQLGFIGGNSYTYAAMTALAASCVAISLIHNFNLASLLIQVSFIALSIVGMIRTMVLTRMARFSEEDSRFVGAKFATLSPHLARKFLSRGTWVDVAQGQVLATEGAPLEQLSYLASGEVSVFVGGHLVGTRPATTYIGELSALHDLEATATVVAASDARCFVISAQRLRKLAALHPEILHALIASFTENTRETLRLRSVELSELRGTHSGAGPITAGS